MIYRFTLDSLGNEELSGQSPTPGAGTALDSLRCPKSPHGPRLIVEFTVSACFNRRSTTAAHRALAFRPTLAPLVRSRSWSLRATSALPLFSVHRGRRIAEPTVYDV